jgi:hypothetical protein
MYEHVIEHIVSFCPAPDKFAHVFAGMTIWLGAGVLLRKPLSTLLPLCIVVALEVGNEIVDYYAHGGWQWHDTLGDAAATWFWPIVLFTALNACPWLGRRR